MLRLTPLVLTLALTPTLTLSHSLAADPFPLDPLPGDLAMHKYLKVVVDRISAKPLAGITTRAEWDAQRGKMREQFLDMLGLWPLPERTPLKATVTGTLDKHGAVIENVHFQSIPGLYVTGNLYRPKNPPAKKLPAILYVCGHSGRGRDGNKTAFQDHGLWFANNGYVCLIVDTLQLGEVAGKHHGTYNLNRFWWQSRGYTPAGVECWNGIRGIDYLISRPDVDAEKIGVTGISGGGATTVWVAAADERVKVAVPVSGMSDLESYVTNRVVNGHCDCMFAINYPQWEWTTILALHAPKPLLFANSDNDRIFPMDGNKRIVTRLRPLYKEFDASENLDEHVSPGGHDYRPDLRIAIFRFFNEHLRGEKGTVKDAEFPAIAGKELRVFPEDSDLPKDQINDRVDETFVPKANVKLPTKPEEFAAWKAGLVKAMKERSFRGIESNRGLVVPVKWREIHEMGWTRKNPPNTVERSLALLGDTVDSMRVAELTSQKPSNSKRLVGQGSEGILLAYAALLEPGLADEIVITDPPTSHRDGPHFLGIQRVLDIPDALGLLAPDVKVTLIGANAKDKAFDKTAAIYKLAGAEAKFQRE